MLQCSRYEHHPKDKGLLYWRREVADRTIMLQIMNEQIQENTSKLNTENLSRSNATIV